MFGVHVHLNCVLMGQFYKGIISYNSFVKFIVKALWSHNITILYQNMCYNNIWYKGTALY